MYISKKYHILTDALISTAIINLIAAAIMIAIRLTVGKQIVSSPDMLNRSIVTIGNLTAITKMVLTLAVFSYAVRRLNRARSIISKDDYTELAKLQEEANPSGIAYLSSYSTYQLLQLWGFILVGINFLQEMGGAMYQRFIATLSLTIVESSSEEFVSIYNGTHGFKYMGMVTAFIIAIFVTGVFIRDRRLKYAAIALMLVFILAFVVLQMNTITLAGRTIGIVWTSVIYHTIDTIGLLVLAIYLRKK